MMRSLSSARVLGCVLVMGVAGGAAAQSPSPASRSGDHAYRIVPVAEGLQNPWSIAFLPDGDMLVTERPGRLRVVRKGVLQPDPIEGVPEVRAQGQGGLMEVLPHPDFESNRLLYLSLSKPRDDGQATTAIVRGRLDGHRLTDIEEIFEAQAWSKAGQHFGSKLAFDGQGYLFITVGDRGANPGLQATHPSQDLTNHQGTVIRLHDDGRVPTDNPFVGRSDALPEIWSYGHRNPQGLIVHPESGDVWVTEHGPQGGDELNLVVRGHNYGWPVIGYGVNYGPQRAPIHEGTHREGMEQPAHYWVPSIGTSGLMLYTGDRFPQWRGNLFAGGLSGQYVERLTLKGRQVASHEKVAESTGRVRDIRQGPDGLIYVAVDDRGGAPSALVRIEPVARN